MCAPAAKREPVDRGREQMEHSADGGRRYFSEEVPAVMRLPLQDSASMPIWYSSKPRLQKTDAALAAERPDLTTAATGSIAREAAVRRVEPFHFSPRYGGPEARRL